LIDVNLEEGVVDAILGLEQNWRPPLKDNEQVMLTLQVLQNLEIKASPKIVMSNWRFQQLMYRGYYDAYVQQRLEYEAEIERNALSVLGQWSSIGSQAAIEQAKEILVNSREAWSDKVVPEWKSALFSYGRSLYSSIGMQLSVPLFRAYSLGRGANLDSVDLPLNNVKYLLQQFDILNKQTEKERQEGINDILNWRDPGPGGFYDNLGDVTAQPHLLLGEGVTKDPSFYFTPAAGWQEPFDNNVPVLPLTWYYWEETTYGAKLELQYTELDPAAQYMVKIVYSGDSFGVDVLVRLVADDQFIVHGYIQKPWPIKPILLNITQQATSDGNLKLSFNQAPGGGGNGRGCQVSEVWLMNTLFTPTKKI